MLLATKFAESTVDINSISSAVKISFGDNICDIVEKWMSQVHPHDMSFGNLTYCNGFFDAIEALRSNLRQDT